MTDQPNTPLLLQTSTGLELEPDPDLEGHYTAYDDLGCQYWVHGGAAYWQAQYAKSGHLHLSVGEYVGSADPESALRLLEVAREGFIQWLFTIEAVRMQVVGKEEPVVLPVEDIPPFKAVVDNPTHMSGTEAAYKALLSGNKSGQYTDQISIFWDHYVNQITD